MGREDDLDSIKNEYLFVRVDGFEHDAQYNIYEKEGNFLMNPEMIRNRSLCFYRINGLSPVEHIKKRAYKALFFMGIEIFIVFQDSVQKNL